MTTQELHLAAAKAMGWEYVNHDDRSGYPPVWIGIPDKRPVDIRFTIRDVGPIIERYGITLVYWPREAYDEETPYWEPQVLNVAPIPSTRDSDMLTAVLTLVVKLAEAGKLKEVTK